MRDLKATFLADAVDVEDEAAHTTAWVDVSLTDALTLLLRGVKAGTAGNLTVKLQAAMESAEDLNKAVGAPTPRATIDIPLLDEGTPATSVTLSATGNAILSRPREDRYRSVRLHYIAAATTDETNKWAITTQLVTS